MSKVSNHGKSSGYTLIEIMVTLVIVTIIVSYGTFSYKKMVMKNLRNSSNLVLTQIYAAQKIYLSANGNYWPEDAATYNNLTDIANGLGMDLTNVDFNTDKVGFTCARRTGAAPGTDWRCTANSTGSAYFLGEFSCTINDQTDTPIDTSAFQKCYN